MKRNNASRFLALPLAVVLAAGLAGCGMIGGKAKPQTPTLGDRVPILSKIESKEGILQSIKDFLGKGK